ncbi:MAG TPA: CHAT domain-containing protein [Gemmatimonadaceae bacterium]|nr:CHAT domain-containing protein [Gemmatimonadaceae bacterium]
MVDSPSPGRPISLLASRRVVGIAVLLAAIAGTGIAAKTLRARASVAGLSGAPVPRRLVARLSIPSVHAHCREDASASCASGGDRGARRRALARADRRDTPGAADSRAQAHARAIVSLLWAAEVGNAVDASISILERLAETAPTAAILTDLAAARHVRWERGGSVRDLLAALDASDRAVALDETSPAARFNLALALERLHLDRMAAEAWRDYLVRERDGAWRAEGERRATALRRSHARAPSYDEPSPRLRAWAERNAQGARELAMDEWLPAWGAAVMTAPMRADSILEATRALAVPLRDSTVAHAVASIDASAHDSIALRRLGAAHARYGRAQRGFLRASYSTAAQLFDSVRTDRAASLPLRLWAASGRVAADVNTGDSSRRRALARGVLDDDRSRAFPAVRARVLWASGTAALRGGVDGVALARFQEARAEYRRAGEGVNAAALDYLLGETWLRGGDEEAGFRSVREALAGLQRERPVVWLHNALYVLSRAVDGEGHRAAARWIAREDARTAAELDSTRVRRELYMLEALLGLARIALPHPDTVAALLASAPDLLARLAGSPVHPFMRHAHAAVRARALVHSDPRRALPLLDSAIAFFLPINRVRALPPLLLRADARAAVGDVEGAAADLDAASSLLDANRAAVTGEWHRATMLAAARRIDAKLVQRFAARGDAERSLRYLDRARRSFIRVPHDAPLRMRAGTVALTWTLLGDTLLTWTVDARGPVLTRRLIAADSIVMLVASTRHALERHDGGRSRPALEALHSLLLAPIARRLGDSSTLVVVADGSLAGVPFAALRDARTGRYLVERHVIVSAPSVRDAIGFSGARRRFATERILLVGGPDLSHAMEEIAAIGAIYHAPRTLVGANARSGAVVAALPGAGVVHVAAHALSDPVRPERSHLVLGDRALTAEALDRLDLSRTRLVVLAACETMAPDAGGVAYRGLADAFRQAGVHGVVGSIWRVDDRSTRALMTRFHARLVVTDDAGTALAEAQRAMLEDTDRSLASPSAWAGFQFSGPAPLPRRM